MGRLYRGRYRRLLIPRYPFGVFYVVESYRIVIHAVPDLRPFGSRGRRVEKNIKSRYLFIADDDHVQSRIGRHPAARTGAPC